MSTSTERLAAQLALLRSRMDRQARTPQLANSSIENGSVKVKDAAGALTLIVGQQYDGTASAAVVNGPVPPTPTIPVLASMPGGVQVTWDGTFVDPQEGWSSPVVAPMDFARIDIHASATSGFAVTAGTKVGEIMSPAGGSTAVNMLNTAAVTRYVKLVVVSLAGKSSAASAQATLSIPGAVPDSRIDAIDTRIGGAETDAAAAQTKATTALNTANAVDTRVDGLTTRVTTLETETYKMKRGSASVTTNGTGYVTITHGLGVAPAAVFCMSREGLAAGGHSFAVTGVAASTFTARVYLSDAPLLNTQLDIFWLAVA